MSKIKITIRRKELKEGIEQIYRSHTFKNLKGLSEDIDIPESTLWETVNGSVYSLTTVMSIGAYYFGDALKFIDYRLKVNNKN